MLSNYTNVNRRWDCSVRRLRLKQEKEITCTMKVQTRSWLTGADMFIAPRAILTLVPRKCFTIASFFAMNDGLWIHFHENQSINWFGNYHSIANFCFRKDSHRQLLCFWTLPIVLFLFKTYVSETGFCVRLQVEPTQLGPIDKASPYHRIFEILFTDTCALM
jgi:hypothetical protein